jgi:hypothetical protein
MGGRALEVLVRERGRANCLEACNLKNSRMIILAIGLLDMPDTKELVDVEMTRSRGSPSLQRGQHKTHPK